MPPKRKSFLDTLEKELPAPPDAEVPAETPAAPASPAKVPPSALKKRNTLYLSDPVMDRLREIAFTERRRLHDLFLEGIDHVIASRGHPERTTKE